MKYEGKYRPLFDYLSHNHMDEVVLDLCRYRVGVAGGAACVGAQRRGWWSNRGRGSLQAAAWMDAGYEVSSIDLTTREVVFRKLKRRYEVRRVGDTILWDGDLVHALRDHLGVSQAQLAETLGMRQQTVSEWETGVYAPTRATSKFLTLVAERAGFNFGEEASDQGDCASQPA